MNLSTKFLKFESAIEIPARSHIFHVSISQIVHFFTTAGLFFQLLRQRKHSYQKTKVLATDLEKNQRIFTLKELKLKNCPFGKKVQKSDVIDHLFPFQLIRLKQLSR